MNTRNLERLAPPPREVDRLTKLNVLLNNFMMQFSWLFLGIGLIFVWVFGGNADLTIFIPHGNMIKARGIINKIVSTGFSVNEETVLAYHFSFMDKYGNVHKNISYSVDDDYDVGDAVDIKYSEKNPSYAYIVGMRIKPFGVWVLFIVSIFPLLGIIFIIISFKHGMKIIRLLQNGKVVEGEFVDAFDTGIRINDSIVYKVRFKFTVNGKEYIVAIKTRNEDIVEEQDNKYFLYDYRNPNIVFLVDDIKSVKVRDGKFVAHGPMLIALLILPIATITIHGLIIILKILL